MDRSPGFGSTSHNFDALFRLDFSSAPHLLVLNLAMKCNSLDRSTKSTISHIYSALSACKHRVSGSFHSPPGVLFTFPSRYLSLSVTEEYLALEGGPSDFPQGSSCLVVLWILLRHIEFRLLDSHHLWSYFPLCSTILYESLIQSLTPDIFLSLVWALPLSLAATQGIDFSFFSCGYLDVSVPHVSLPYTIDSYMDTWISSSK